MQEVFCHAKNNGEESAWANADGSFPLLGLKLTYGHSPKQEDLDQKIARAAHYASSICYLLPFKR
jgi:hypothetical protein